MRALTLSIGTALCLFSCAQEPKETFTTISGTITGSELQEVKIYGDRFEASLRVEDGRFTDTLKLSKSDYYTLRIGREYAQMYLQPGNQIDLIVNTEEFDESITFTGAGSKANNYLTAKFLASEQEKGFAELFAMNETDFLAENKKYTQRYLDLLNSTEGLDADFLKKEGQEIHYSHLTDIENYQDHYRYLGKTPESKKFVVSEGFYDEMEGMDMADTTAFRNSAGYRRLIEAHFNRLAEERIDKDQTAHKTLTYIAVVDEALPNGYAKDEILASYLRFGLKPDNRLEDVAEAFLTTQPSEENLVMFTEKYEMYKTIIPGLDSPDFNYENHAGGKTALADLNGRYLYVDIWATWCGPCIREIPSLKQLEADYQDKNIEFVSISIDKSNDYDKWKQMVVDRELGGVQLMADKDWQSDFVVGYGIEGIPRFIVIGPDGKIINADAPRPSNPEIRAIFDELI